MKTRIVLVVLWLSLLVGVLIAASSRTPAMQVLEQRVEDAAAAEGVELPVMEVID